MTVPADEVGVDPRSPSEDDPRGGEAETEPATLRQAMAHGVLWSAVSLVAKQVGRVGISIVLARLLGPKSYGIVGQATVYIMLISFLLDGGFGAAFIQKDRVDRRDESSVYWMTLVSSSVLAVITLLVAPLLASFFRTPELTAVVRVLAADVLLLGLASAPIAILTRRLRFRPLAVAQVAATAIGGASSIAAALAGAGYWALVIYAVVSDAVVFVVVSAACGAPPLRPSLASLRRLWSFGTRVMGTQLLYYAMRSADNVLIGRFLGAVALGYYALSYRVLMLPQQTLGYMVNRVSLPVFSRLQDDRPRMGRYFLKATGVVAFVCFPAMTLVFVAADAIVPVVFGDRWLPAIVPMQILAVAGLMSSVQHLVRPVLYASGRQRLALRLQSALTVTSVLAFTLGLRWGITGVAAAVAIVLWTFGPVLVHYAAREAHVSLRDYALTLTPAGASCLALLAAFELTALALSGAGAPLDMSLAVSAAAGIGAYLLALRILWPSDFSMAVRSVMTFARPNRLAGAVAVGGGHPKAGAVSGAG